MLGQQRTRYHPAPVLVGIGLGAILWFSVTAGFMHNEEPIGATDRISAPVRPPTEIAELLFKDEFPTLRKQPLTSKIDERLSREFNDAGFIDLLVVDVQVGGSFPQAGGSIRVVAPSHGLHCRIAVDRRTGRAFKLYGFKNSEFYELASSRRLWEQSASPGSALVRLFVAVSASGRWVEAVESPSEAEVAVDALVAYLGTACNLNDQKKAVGDLLRRSDVTDAVHGLLLSTDRNGVPIVQVSTLLYDGTDLSIVGLSLRWPRNASPTIIEQKSRFQLSDVFGPC